MIRRTREMVLALPAGRVLDYYVYAYGIGGEIKTIGYLGDVDWYSNWAKLPNYSTDVGVALATLVDRFGDDVTLKYNDSGVFWDCELYGDGAKDGHGTADGHEAKSAALAICRALIDLRWKEALREEA